MTARLLIGCLILSVILPACSRVRVHVEIDAEADFGTYHTFSFLPHAGNERASQKLPPRLKIISDPHFQKHIQGEIKSDLGGRGLSEAAQQAKADLLIGYSTVVRSRAERVPPVVGTGRHGHHYVIHPGRIKWYKEGTLVIDVIDADSHVLVWRGIGTGMLRDMHPGPELRAAIREILEQFPMPG